MSPPRPPSAGAAGAVWGLDTGRPGEFLQVAALGRSLGLPFKAVRLSPAAALPNALPAGPPARLILSFGRAAQASLHLANHLPVRPLLVHLGTPGQIPTAAFDLVIPMPQDDYPPAPNVHFLRLPLNGAGTEAAALPAPGGGGSQTVILVGGPTRHFRLGPRSIWRLLQFGARLAAANGEALRVVTSPRTPGTALAQLRQLCAGQGFALDLYGGGVPFRQTLQSGGRFVVTGDSASMLAEACRTGAPVWLFPLPGRPNLNTLLQKLSDRCLGRGPRHALVQRGWVGGGTDYRRWHCALERLGYMRIARSVPEAALRWVPAGTRPDTDLRDCRDRLLGMLGA